MNLHHYGVQLEFLRTVDNNGAEISLDFIALNDSTKFTKKIRQLD